MFSSAFVCLFAGLRDRYSQNSVERWHMDHGKKPLDFGGNALHVTLGLVLGGTWGHCGTLRDHQHAAASWCGALVVRSQLLDLPPGTRFQLTSGHSAFCPQLKTYLFTYLLTCSWPNYVINADYHRRLFIFLMYFMFLFSFLICAVRRSWAPVEGRHSTAWWWWWWWRWWWWCYSVFI